MRRWAFAWAWTVGVLLGSLPAVSQPLLSYQGCSCSGGGSGGSGTVESVGLSVPSWLSVANSPVTTSGTLAVTAATGQTAGRVIGTCGAATSFGVCALVDSDIPNNITVDNATTASALASNPANCSAGNYPLGISATGTAEGCTADGPATYAASTSAAGPATTATALAANPTNCSAGNYPLGIDASGNVESCTAVTAGIGGSTGSLDNALLKASGTGGSTAQASTVTLLNGVFTNTTTDTGFTFVPNGTGVVAIGNLTLVGNTLASTNTNGDIAINPNGSGNITSTRSLVTGAGGNGVFLGSISTPVAALNSGGSGTVDLRSGGAIVWSNDSNSSSSTKDTGLKRLAAGKIQGTDGGAGALTAFQLTSTVGLFQGTGSPEGVVTAGVGSLYMRTDGGAGTSVYVKESGTGNTGWKALAGI